MSEIELNNNEQVLLDCLNPFKDIDTVPQDLTGKAVSLLAYVHELVSTKGTDQIRRSVWHEYLNISGKSKFLSSLDSTAARNQWADDMFELVDITQYSLSTLFEQRVGEHPQRALFRQLDTHNTQWSYAQTYDYMKKVAAAFYTAAGEPRVLLYLDNCPEGACADLACLTFGILDSPVDRHFDKETLSFIVKKLAINIVVTDTEARLHHLVEVEKQTGIPLKIFVTDPQNRELRKTDLYLREASSRFSTREAEEILAINPPPDLHKISTVMFTSGSTGEPKGVAFTNFNLISKRFARAAALPEVGHDEVLFCYLPLFHTFGRYLEMMGMLYWSGTYVFAGNTSRETFLQRLCEVQPTGLIGIPLRWRQIQQKCLEQLDASATTEFEQSIFRSVVGFRLRWGLSAAGYLSPKTFRFFNRNGVALCSGFGMTEATGGITMTIPRAYRENSVGRPLPGMLTRLNEETELEIGGPYMARYLNDIGGDDPAGESFNARTDIPWMKTGDLFKVDDGQYQIVDRLKDIYKNNRGQTVAPRRVEQKFNDVPGIKNVFLVGDARDYNVLLIVPDLDEQLLGDAADDQERELYFQNIVTAANQELMPYERVINIAILDRDFDIEKGELTPKGSFKRKQVEKNFAALIEGLYVRNFVEFDCPGLTIQVPRWFFRDLGILEADNIECSGDGLYDKVRDLFLPVRLVDDNVLIGDLEYSLENGNVDLGLFARQPLLWAGNPSLVAFCPCKEGWDAQFSGIARHVFLPYRKATELSTIDTHRSAFSDQNLGRAHELFTLALFNDEAVSSAAIDELEDMLADSNAHMISLIMSRLEALARHPLENIRCQAYAINLLNRPMDDFKTVYPAFLSSGLTFLNDEFIHKIGNRNIERRRLDAFRYRMLYYRTGLPWPASSVMVDQIGKLLILMADFVKNSPEFYYAVRGELASWVVHKTDAILMNKAEDLLADLRHWYENYLQAKISFCDEACWNERMVFEEGISAFEIKRLTKAFSTSTFLYKSIFLTCDVLDFDINNVPPGGIWFSRLLSQRGQHIYRVSINTTDGNHYGLMVTLREDYAEQAVRKVLYWQMAISDHPYGPYTLPRLGCSRADLGVLSVAFVNNLTVWERIREFSSSRTSVFVEKRPNFLRQLFTRAMAAFFAASRNSGYEIIPGLLSPSNVVIAEPDYRAGATILSMGGWQIYDGPLRMVRALIKNFYEQTAMHYPWSAGTLERSWVFDAGIEALGDEEGRVFLQQLYADLEGSTISGEQSLRKKLAVYLKAMGSQYYVPIALRNAVQRYKDWHESNPDATNLARQNLIDTLVELYSIDRYDETARYYMYRHTYFDDAPAEVRRAFDHLLGVLYENPDLPAISSPALSDLQASLPSSADRHVFGHLVFPRANEASQLEVLSVGDRSIKHVVVRSQIKARDNTRYYVREATEPTEIGQLYRLFLRQRFTKKVKEHDRFLILTDKLDRLVGGVCYVLESDKVAKLDGIVIASQLQGHGLGDALLEDFCMRMSNHGFEVIRTHFYRRNFYLHRGFKTDKRWGGLIRFLEKEKGTNLPNN